MIPQLSPKEKSCPEKSGQLSLSKKPRRVRTRRCEKDEICFFRRHVRRKKHFSARKCASCPLKADNECAQWAAAFLEKVAKPLFRQSQKTAVLPDGRLFCWQHTSAGSPGAVLLYEFLIKRFIRFIGAAECGPAVKPQTCCQSFSCRHGRGGVYAGENTSRPASVRVVR